MPSGQRPRPVEVRAWLNDATDVRSNFVNSPRLCCRLTAKTGRETEMPMIRATNLRRAPADHFEPDDKVDPKAQRQLRGQLEQIDYIAYAANRKVLSTAIGRADAQRFERLARASALARTQWVTAALAATEGGHTPTNGEIEKLAHARAAYEELTEVY